MKTIGLLGGLSWESTVSYYQIINRTVGERRGGLHSARIILNSVDFEEIERLQHEGRWPEAGSILADAAAAVERAGADFLVICTNTMHRVASDIESRIRIPLLHIADPTARALQSVGFSVVGLLSTKFTMEQSFYRGRLEENFAMTVHIPGNASRRLVHSVIYDELCRGIISERSREAFKNVVDELVEAGSEAVVLGCTEIGLLLRSEDVSVPLFDTTRLHAEAAALWALGE
jgi:aspartate racemase